jgi:KDO2-lipid IV(A) lauroyltransferase
MARSGPRDRLEHLAYLLARRLARALPAGPRSWCGARLGELFAVFGRARRRVARFNLALAFPELDRVQRRGLEREVARHFGRVALDTLRLQGLGPEELEAMATVRGREHFEAALGMGRGVIVLSGHLGSWEVAALAAGRMVEGGLAIVNRPLDNPLLEAELEKLRGRFGNRVLGRRHVARDILRALAGGGAVGLLLDQRALVREGVEVPFFGRPAWTHAILAHLVRRTAAPVVPLWGLWHAPGRYTARFDAPLLIDTLPSTEQGEVAFTARINRIYEDIIRERPEQWLWYHDRWREVRTGDLDRDARPSRRE